MSNNESVQAFETGTPANLEAIKFGREKIRAVEAATGKTPTLVARAVEALQREYDEQTGSAQRPHESRA